MRLVACPDCHAQYDVTGLPEEPIACRCGGRVEVRERTGVDAEVHRCGSCGAIVSAKDSACGYCGSEILRDSHRLSLICPECLARNREESRFCTACGVAFRPEPLPGGREELPCPCCGALMSPGAVAAVQLEECPGCRGLWIPGDGFDRLVARTIETQRARDPIELRARPPRVRGGNPLSQALAYRRCPACEQFMQRENFRKRSGVILDRCREHGTWLDADELEAIAGFVQSGGIEAADAERAEEKRRADQRSKLDFARIAAEHGAWRGEAAGQAAGGELIGSLLELLTNALRLR